MRVLPLSILATLLVLLWAVQAGAQQTLRVTDAVSLLSALRTAKGGEVIRLADGDYGEVRMRGAYQGVNIGRFDRPVTVIPETPGGARFDALGVANARNLTFDGLAVKRGMAFVASQDVAFLNGTATHFFMREVDGLTLAGNHVSGGEITLSMISVANFAIRDNLFEKATLDIMQIGRNTHHGVIENNILRDPQAAKPGAHPDLMQFYGLNGATPHDITIRGNYLYDDLGTGLVGAQGIFMSDARDGQPYRNILIEQNMLAVRHPNAIYIAGGEENVVIRNNSLIAGFTGGYRGGTIRLAKREGWTNAGVTVTGNIAAGILDETKRSRIGRNLLYPEASAIFQGPGADWTDFLLRNPQRFEGLGAEQRIEEFRTGIR